MSKRTKKFGSKRSGLKLEALEQRQLLATIVAGSGEEVVSSHLLDGKVYDQILLTGSSITVDADAGEIVRVDWLDESGDIVRAEFSGSGQMTISLDNFVAAATPENYATDVEYVGGLASITIEGSDSSSSVNIHSLGTANVFLGEDNPIFEGGLDGGDNFANVARLVIEGDITSPLGSNFGSIFAGNAVFGGESGAVGLVAPDVQFTGTITLGDINAAEDATPVIWLGDFSDTDTVTIAGGDLSSDNDEEVDTDNVETLISSSGTTSNGELLETQIIAAANVDLAADKIEYTSSAETLTITDEWTQDDLDELQTRFLNDVIIEGGLAQGLVLAARSFGDITVKGDLAGLITTDVIAKGEGKADAGELGIGNVTIEGDILAGGAIESSTWMGDVTVEGGIDFTDDALEDMDLDPDDFKWGVWGAYKAAAVISTLGNADLDSSIGDITFSLEDSDGEEIGDVNLAGKMALVRSSTVGGDEDAGAGIGNISLRSLTSSGTDVIKAGIVGGIGNVTVEDDLVLSSTGTVILTADGSIGDITAGSDINVSGNITAAGADNDIGDISAESSVKLGNLTAADNIGTITAGTTLTIGSATATSGNLGDLTSAGTTSVGEIKADAVGNITVEGTAMTLTLAAITADHADDATIGNISSSGSMTLGGDIKGDSVGNITITGKGDLAINGDITAVEGSIGDIVIEDDGNMTLGAGATVSATVSIGDITVTDGTLTFTDSESKFVAVDGSDWEDTSIGNVTVEGGKGIEGVAGSIEFQANQIGDVTVSGSEAGGVLVNVIFSAKGTTEDTVNAASIGDIYLENADSSGSIAEGEASTSGATGTGFSSSGSIGDVEIETSTSGKLLATTGASLIFRAGSSEMGSATDAAYTDGADAGGGVSIGDVTVSANLTADLTTIDPDAADPNGVAGAGFVVASGVNIAANGVFASAADGGALAVPAKLGTGGSIDALVLNDLSGGIEYAGFGSSTLTEDTSADDSALTAGSIIVADTIASIRVNIGTSLVNLTGDNAPTGIALKGVIGDNAAYTGTADTVFDADTSSNLLVVIL